MPMRLTNGFEMNSPELAEKGTLDAVHRELHRRLNGNATRVSCELTPGSLRLHGQLSSYYHKQLAQEAVFGISRGRRILNEILVVPADAAAG